MVSICVMFMCDTIGTVSAGSVESGGMSCPRDAAMAGCRHDIDGQSVEGTSLLQTAKRVDRNIKSHHKEKHGLTAAHGSETDHGKASQNTTSHAIKHADGTQSKHGKNKWWWDSDNEEDNEEDNETKKEASSEDESNEDTADTAIGYSETSEEDRLTNGQRKKMEKAMSKAMAKEEKAKNGERKAMAKAMAKQEQAMANEEKAMTKAASEKDPEKSSAWLGWFHPCSVAVVVLALIG